ncbi:hypothetical protein [Undibacterium aquatile]|uniref:Uncharacterized protein n=1 Tax=Undibacterium aquatile TaxID=1537398 RepID=A0ABR6XAZ6_9BURK|nr:hypothetical protein [Undibacterium aquatile]MBC3810097.1 hypothetical protein [Undibacterium aquatile]
MNSIEEMAVTKEDDWDDGEYIVQRMEWVHAANKRPTFKDYSNARDANDNVLCESLENKNSYLAILYDEEGSCQYTEYQQYLRLITYWLRCVRDDTTYSDFCDAIKLEPHGDQVKKIAPLGSFIYEFHKDWGDVRGVQDDMEWIKTNHRLFMPAWIEVVEPGSIVPSGVMAVTVPDGVSKAEHLDRIFEVLLEQSKKIGSKPKYQIEKVRGENFADTAQRLHVSSYVYDQFDFLNDSVRDVTRKYRSEWELFQGMQGTDFKHVESVDELEDFVEANRRTIRRWKETYDLCKIKAISNTFPPKHTSTKK